MTLKTQTIGKLKTASYIDKEWKEIVIENVSYINNMNDGIQLYIFQGHCVKQKVMTISFDEMNSELEVIDQSSN